MPIQWQRVHKLPDYVRNFPHSAHLNAGVSCISCHGNIARMPVVWQHESLSMGWCLSCHRDPEKNLVPRKGDAMPDGGKAYEDMMTRLFAVEKMQEDSEASLARGTDLYKQRKIAAPENCGACHY
jgi:mono/diheme cytochrome c family protein